MQRPAIRALIPNLVTLSGLCFGITSMRFALEGQFQASLICILLAAACDLLDGMLAALLNAQSELGAQLDSLAAHQFGGSEESKDQRAARLESGFHNDNMIPFPQARVLSIIKRKKTIDLDALYKALKRQHNRDKNEKRE